MVIRLIRAPGAHRTENRAIIKETGSILTSQGAPLLGETPYNILSEYRITFML